jgi:hypothetical protein
VQASDSPSDSELTEVPLSATTDAKSKSKGTYVSKVLGNTTNRSRKDRQKNAVVLAERTPTPCLWPLVRLSPKPDLLVKFYVDNNFPSKISQQPLVYCIVRVEAIFSQFFSPFSILYSLSLSLPLLAFFYFLWLEVFCLLSSIRPLVHLSLLFVKFLFIQLKSVQISFLQSPVLLFLQSLTPSLPFFSLLLRPYLSSVSYSILTFLHPFSFFIVHFLVNLSNCFPLLYFSSFPSPTLSLSPPPSLDIL